MDSSIFASNFNKLTNLLVPIVVIAIAAIIIISITQNIKHYTRKRDELKKLKEQFGKLLPQSYLVEPCTKCFEDQMEFIEFTKNARSIHYKCENCNKKKYSPAVSHETTELVQLWNEIIDLTKKLGDRSDEIVMSFQTPQLPLPFEKTTRSPIPETIRWQIWRRDGGKCVECSSNQNLEFDHIIPVSRGGATSLQNLQLLCKQCNRSKGAKI